MMLGNLEERADQLLDEGDMAGAETLASDLERSRAVARYGRAVRLNQLELVGKRLS
jgi:hypothetical protein